EPESDIRFRSVPACHQTFRLSERQSQRIHWRLDVSGKPVNPERQPWWAWLRIRLLHLWFLLRRPMTLGVRGVIFDRERNAVFLIRHTYVPGWQFPGGGVELGETCLEALEREVFEEGNIEIAT